MICQKCNDNVPDRNGRCPYCGTPLGTQATTQRATPVPGRNALGIPTLTFNANGVGLTMVRVERGSFYRGISLEALKEEISQGTDWRKDYPLVTLETYYISETLLTQEQWEAVMPDNDNNIAYWDDKKGIYNPSSFKGMDLPVNGIDLHSANQFINKLNSITGWVFDLPTNDEWEFAARGGNLSKGYKYAGSDNINEVAWHRGNSSVRKLVWKGLFPQQERRWLPHPVKTKLPNELGLYDMSGNVSDLCRRHRMFSADIRGGSFEDDAQNCETANLYSEYKPENIGCHIVLRTADNWILQVRR